MNVGLVFEPSDVLQDIKFIYSFVCTELKRGVPVLEVCVLRNMTVAIGAVTEFIVRTIIVVTGVTAVNTWQVLTSPFLYSIHSNPGPISVLRCTESGL